MPYDFHLDPEKKWRQQYLTCKNHILPFILEKVNLPPNAQILEIGCGEGGVLKAFIERGFTCYGIDLSPSRIENARKILKEEVEKKLVVFYAFDIHDDQHFEHLFGKIDLVILKDAIEHIHDQKKFLTALHKFIKPEGCVFLSFPPWYNPFGGHQQIAASVLRYVPWFHMTPRGLYRNILKLFGETEQRIRGLLEIYDTRLSIRKFDQILSQTNWQVRRRQFFLVNPGYEVKFGLKPRKQIGFVGHIPELRDFISTAVYYVVSKSLKK